MSGETKVTITGDATGLFKVLGDASKATQGAAKEMEGAAGGVKNLLMGFAAPLAALGAVLGGKEFLKGTIDETKTWTVEAQKLGRVLGITTERASVLNLAIGDIYGTQEEYLGAVAKLTKTLNSNEEAFRRLGVETRDHGRRLKDTPTIMAEVNQKLMEMKSGTDRNIASAQIYGKSWMEVQRYLKLTPEVMQAAQEKAERLNLIVGSDAVVATEAYRASMNDLEDVVKALKIRLGNELMPLLSDFNNLMADQGPNAMGVMGVSIGVIRTQIVSFWEAAKVIFNGLKLGILEIANAISTFSSVTAEIQAGNYKKAKEAYSEGNDKAKALVAEYTQQAIEANRKLRESFQLIWGEKNAPMGPVQDKPNIGKGATPHDKDVDKEFERLKASLERYRYLYENSGTIAGEYHEITKAQEALFWKGILETNDMGEKTRLKVRQEYYKAARAELKKNHEDSKALDEVYRDRYLAEQRAFLDEEAAVVDRQLAQGQISDQQALEWKRAIELDKYNLELSGLNDRLAVKGLEPLEVAKLNGQVEALEASHQAKLRELRNNQADLDRQRDGWAGWAEGIRGSLAQAQNHFETFKQAAVSVIQGVENAFAAGVQGILSGQMTLGQGIKTIWRGIVSTIIQAISQLIARYLMLQIADAVLTKSQVAGSGVKTAAYLTEGAAGAWAAYGWMPFVGAGLATAQIALMNATVAAAGILGGASKVFAGGSLAEGGEVTGAASGGWFNRPTLTMIGEGTRPELVVPDVSFRDFATNLAANILRQERQAQDYGRQAAGYASARALVPAGAAAGGAPFAFDLRGSMFLGSESETRRMFADLAFSALQDRERRES